MLFKAALLVLFLWLPGLSAGYELGDFLHGFLFLALMLLLVVFLGARGAFMGRVLRETKKTS